jgi:serine O-acetyltransferase
MILYRIGNFFYTHRIPFIPKIFDLLIRLIHNSAVFSCCKIGSGTKFAYGSIAVVIHRRAVIGTSCMIGSCVTIGGKSGSKSVPVIGNNVYIATGAKILGDITVGDNCVIGANAVLINSIPNNTLVAGIPAKILKSDINPKDYY